jgi:hypothetical protein
MKYLLHYTTNKKLDDMYIKKYNLKINDKNTIIDQMYGKEDLAMNRYCYECEIPFLGSIINFLIQDFHCLLIDDRFENGDIDIEIADDYLG